MKLCLSVILSNSPSGSLSHSVPSTALCCEVIKRLSLIARIYCLFAAPGQHLKNANSLFVHFLKMLIGQDIFGFQRLLKTDA